MMKKIISAIPGFRTGQLWKKIIAFIAYPVLIIAIIAIIFGSDSGSVSSFDNMISRWQSATLIFFLILIPYTLITNLGNLRGKLPLFKSSSLFKKIVAWILSIVIVFIGFGVTNSALSNKHSPEYNALQQQLDEQRAEKEAVDKAKKAEEKARKESERQAKLAKEAEEKAAQASEQKAKKEAEEQAKLAKLEGDKAKEEVDKQAKLAAQAAEETKSTDEGPSSFTKSVSSWFGGLFGNSNDDDSNESVMKRFEKHLKKGNKESILEIYYAADAQTKQMIEERSNEYLLTIIRDSRDLFIGKKMDKIKKLYGEMEFINEIPNMMNRDAGVVLKDVKELIDTNDALENLKSEHSNLKYGIIKDISQVQNIDCYVNYRIQSRIQIGNLTIDDDSYTDQYYISSYTYNEFLGDMPSDNWGAVLQLNKTTKLTQAGVYKINAISIGTTTLIDSKGFEKDYPVYREVSQADIDKYYQVNELIEQQSQLKTSIDERINHIISRL